MCALLEEYGGYDYNDNDDDDDDEDELTKKKSRIRHHCQLSHENSDDGDVEDTTTCFSAGVQSDVVKQVVGCAGKKMAQNWRYLITY